MPKSPRQLTVASFLKGNPLDHPPSGKKGKKRKLSLSPNATTVGPTKKTNESTSPVSKPDNAHVSLLPMATSPSGSSHTPGLPQKPTPSPPLLPYQLRTSRNKTNKNKNLSKSSTFSRMDSDLLELACGEEYVEPPTADEAEAMLMEETETASTSDQHSVPSSPTAAVKAAIEAKIVENIDTLFVNNVHVDCNKKPVPSPSLAPFLAPPKKPQPLFPEGFPPLTSNRPPNSSARGYFTSPVGVQGGNANSRNDATKNKSTYATKTKTPPKGKVLVQNILYVYATKFSKKSLTPWEWASVDNHLIERLNALNLDDTNLIRIANSGYDVTHKCGFVACRDQASEVWVKAALEVTPFRAWSKGEQPEVRLCRLFFPARFDCLQDDRLIPLLCKYNPPLKQATLTLKSSDLVQGGRAIFLEMDSATYGFVKSKQHKLEFTMMDIDCQPVFPTKKTPTVEPSKKTPTVDGITKISADKLAVRPAALGGAPVVSAVAPAGAPATAPACSSESASAQTEAPILSPPPVSNPTAQSSSFSAKFAEERKKRERSNDQLFPDASKKKDTLYDTRIKSKNSKKPLNK